MDQIIINADRMNARNAEWSFRFDDMFEALEQLTALLSEENQMLAEFRIGAIAALQEKKSQLAWLIELQKEYLQKHPELLKAMQVEVQERIRSRGEMLEKALEENFQRLTSARLINQKVVQAVTAVMNDHYGEASGYSENGTRGLVIAKDRRGAQALTLNQAV